MSEQMEGMFLHCAKCLGDWRRTNEPCRERLAVISSGDHLQLWCEGCDSNVGIFRLAQPLPATTCQDPGCPEHS